jgi:hypothetical protein
MKGIKLFTKSHLQNSYESLQNSLEQLLEEFPSLDWSYMNGREHGELFIDVGASYNPEEERPLVGLWRLDSLEASHGAAGFTSGNIHHINTLNLCGGLQAEMAKNRSLRNHIVFRSSYNLAYEVTRRVNNKRDLFKEKSVYELDLDFLWDIDRAIKLYENDAGEKSFGVRDEFRIGGQAWDMFCETAHESVSQRVFPTAT